MVINRLKIYSLIKGIKGDYTCFFYKKDGTNREMLCNNDLPTPKGVGESPSRPSNSLVLVLDKEKNDYRLVNLATIYKVIHNDQVYEVN